MSASDLLNYHHLYYFWVVSREGSLTGAARRLNIAPSTVSEQIKRLEDALGQLLLERRGRGLGLTAMGEVVQTYADDIFAIGRELVDAVRTGSGHTQRLRVGVANNLPKLVSFRLLAPVVDLPDPRVHLVCRDGLADRLVGELASHHLDLVLSDATVGLARDVGARIQLLGETATVVLGVPELVERYARGFPGSLTGAPMLLPATGIPLRTDLERWFEASRITPDVVAEFGDSGLLKAFGQAGVGLMPVPLVVADEVCVQYGVRRLGVLTEVVERFYAITMPRRSPNPTIEAILENAAVALAR